MGNRHLEDMQRAFDSYLAMHGEVLVADVDGTELLHRHGEFGLRPPYGFTAWFPTLADAKRCASAFGYNVIATYSLNAPKPPPRGF